MVLAVWCRSLMRNSVGFERRSSLNKENSVLDTQLLSPRPKRATCLRVLLKFEIILPWGISACNSLEERQVPFRG